MSLPKSTTKKPLIDHMSDKQSVWSPVKHGLRKYLPTGEWHFHQRVGARVLSGSSGTALKTLAQEKLAAAVLKCKKETAANVDPNSKETVGELIELYKFRIGSQSFSQKTIDKRLAMISSLLKTWPSLPALRPRDVTLDGILTWRNTYRETRGPDYTNKTVSMLRDVLDLAVKQGTLLVNPAADDEHLAWLPVARRKLVMPSQEQMDKFFDCLQNFSPHTPKARAKHVRDYLEGIMYTGLRKEEASLLRVCHVDLNNWVLNLPAEIVKGRTRARTVPILGEARALFARLVKDAGEDGAVFKVGKRLRSLAAASKKAGLPIVLTIHKLRHLFATTAYECTQDPQVVAQLLGHGDGGKLALDTYAHVRQPKVIAAAAKIVFRPYVSAQGAKT